MFLWAALVSFMGYIALAFCLWHAAAVTCKTKEAIQWSSIVNSNFLKLNRLHNTSTYSPALSWRYNSVYHIVCSPQYSRHMTQSLFTGIKEASRVYDIWFPVIIRCHQQLNQCTNLNMKLTRLHFAIMLFSTIAISLPDPVSSVPWSTSYHTQRRWKGYLVKGWGANFTYCFCTVCFLEIEVIIKVSFIWRTPHCETGS